MTQTNNRKRRLINTVRLIVPVIILILVWNQIDIAKFKATISRINIYLYLLGISQFFILNILASERWRQMVFAYLDIRLPRIYLLKHYWIGMSIGFFLPASVGWDVYRITIVGKRIGNYVVNIYSIVLEKALAFLMMIITILITFPFVRQYVINTGTSFNKVMEILLIFSVGVLLVLLLVYSTIRKQIIIRYLNYFSSLLSRIIEKIARKAGLNSKERIKINLLDFAKPTRNFNKLIPIIVFSAGIVCFSAVKNQIFFQAAGYNIPIVINFLLVPIFFFIWLLPVSFGSVGVREGTFILFYGFFGVPAEVALLISFLNLSGILLNNAVGGVIMLLHNAGKDFAVKKSIQ